MRKEDVIGILCKLLYCGYDNYQTEKTCFQYPFRGRNYEISLQRENGALISFNIEDKGEGANEDN